ncbi:uncharacterized protein LOC111027089 [Myzus persicae]|uniref:uncharacterized protein LOC111027089 n=1 Tax=Myzus persicae TaxID=13164 RepID=UPI000B932797|nr:uncharacterized protein LOC111027089 [Myzus persicae]
MILGKNPGIVSNQLNTADKNDEEFMVAKTLRKIDMKINNVKENSEDAESLTDTSSENESSNDVDENQHDLELDATEYLAGWVAKKYKLQFPELGSTTTTSAFFKLIIIELAEYRSHEGLWAKDILWNNIDGIAARIWWNGLCSNTSLSKVASAILSLPASSAATERSFSSYSLIHTKRRNLLTNLTAKKLLFIYEHINNQDLEVSKSVKSFQTNQESLTTNNDDEEPSCSYQVCSSSSENEEEDYNTDEILESEGDQFGETDSSDDDFFNSIQHTFA